MQIVVSLTIVDRSVPNSTPARFDSICGTAAGAAANTSCVVNSDCASGICNRYTNQCAASCCADSDCPGNTICTVYDFDVATAHLVKVCRTPQTGMAGTGASGLGATCTIDSDCSSGACIPVDPMCLQEHENVRPPAARYLIAALFPLAANASSQWTDCK